MKTFISDISGKEFPLSECIYGRAFRKPIFDMVVKDFPNFSLNSKLSIEEYQSYRQLFLSSYLEEQVGELSDSDRVVLHSLQEQTTLSDKIEDVESKLTLGQRVADKVADFGGSWRFIIMFLTILILWICTNAFILITKPFDPYPFILLNLILSCVAALQAPVIMMSQNRQEEKDRDRAKKDYMINLKSELEIRSMHQKLDHLIIHMQQELIEVEKEHVAAIEEMSKEIVKLSEKQKK